MRGGEGGGRFHRRISWSMARGRQQTLQDTGRGQQAGKGGKAWSCRRERSMVQVLATGLPALAAARIFHPIIAPCQDFSVTCSFIPIQTDQTFLALGWVFVGMWWKGDNNQHDPSGKGTFFSCPALTSRSGIKERVSDQPGTLDRQGP
ncbi:hypothetical protein LZ31DRAFT_78556 [Colletotrichum somersetense]|nr:hypothetical protein LZ31DRAFT_78556 [Colletotrichum somersetense]